MFDELEKQMENGDGSASSRRAWLYQAGGALLAFGVFLLLGWAMWRYAG